MFVDWCICGPQDFLILCTNRFDFKRLFAIIMPNLPLKLKKNVTPRVVIVTKETPPKTVKKPNNKKANICCSWKKCLTKFRTTLELDQHIRTHFENEQFKAPYKCHWDSCDFSCICFHELKRHVYYHGYHSSLCNIGQEECLKANIPVCSLTEPETGWPDLTNNFECHWQNCERNFESIVQFQDHISLHSTFDYDMLKTYEEKMPKARCNWQHCKKTFPNKYRLTEHARKHSNQKLVGCFKCGELFRTRTTLFDHCRRQESNNTRKYQCIKCFKFYATEKLLRNHVVVHVNCFKCTMCDMTCNSSYALATHIRYRHLKDRPIRCPECKHTCVTKSDLAKHKRHVHMKDVQSCGEPGCSYTVKTINSLRRHYLEVHANSPLIYLCHCCDKLFKYGNLLSKHLIAKHKFPLPSGHKRFIYRIDENGFYSLETTRIESLEVTRQILSPVMFEISELTEDSNFEVVSIANANNEITPGNQTESLQKVTITLDDED